MCIRNRISLVGIVITLLILSCDAVAPKEAVPRQFESEHFIYHYTDGDPVNATWQETYYDWLIEIFDADIPEKIHYFKYRDRDHLRRITGMRTNAFAESNSLRLHTIWPVDNHESVHIVVSNTIGTPCALFGEGIAVAHQSNPFKRDTVARWSGRSVHAIARENRQADTIPALDALLESNSFRSIDSNTTYPLAGSFVRFLIDEFGLDPMRFFIARSNPEDRSATIRDQFRSAYGMSVDEAWNRWLAFLDDG